MRRRIKLTSDNENNELFSGLISSSPLDKLNNVVNIKPFLHVFEKRDYAWQTTNSHKGAIAFFTQILSEQNPSMINYD